jgi:hypothetical protein
MRRPRDPDRKKRIEILSGTVYWRISDKFELRIPSLIWITTLFMIGVFLFLWVSDITVFGCHKDPQPLPIKKKVGAVQ